MMKVFLFVYLIICFACLIWMAWEAKHAEVMDDD